MENELKPEEEIIPKYLRGGGELPASISGAEYRRWQLELVAEKYLSGYDIDREDRDISLENEAFARWIKDGYSAKYKDFWGSRVV